MQVGLGLWGAGWLAGSAWASWMQQVVDAGGAGTMGELGGWLCGWRAGGRPLPAVPLPSWAAGVPAVRWVWVMGAGRCTVGVGVESWAV